MSEQDLLGVEANAVPKLEPIHINGVYPKTIYVDGVFDLFHPGHIAFLKKARATSCVPGARLIVGVITDEDAAWKRPTIMSHAERLTMVRHCTEVDAVIEHPPLVLTEEFLDAHKIDLVVHGDDSKQEEFFRVPIEKGAMAYVPYHKGISTSEIIARIRRLPDRHDTGLASPRHEVPTPY
jgi:choline-phosphate cytidylyltransferase